MGSDQRLRKKIDEEAILGQLKQLSGSEFNSFMLRLYRERAEGISAADLMRQYKQSRFTKEADIDTLAFKQLEIRCLEWAIENGFESFTPSPLAPMGTCSAIARVNQNNVVSATRGTEVTSDLTNVMALKTAMQQGASGRNASDLQLAATHRLVRTQPFDNPAYAAHFGILCLTSGGFDRGSYAFEIDQLFRHIHFHQGLIIREAGGAATYTQILLKETSHPFNDFLQKRLEQEKFEFPVKVIQEENPTQYYDLVQFKNFTQFKEEEINTSDGGLVDWTQKLIPNKKHRFFISGSGIELLHKLFNNYFAV